MRGDPAHPDVGEYELVVRDLSEPVLGVRRRRPPSTGANGDRERLFRNAVDAVERRLRLADHAGECVATVTIDIAHYDYEVHWEVEKPLAQRFADAVVSIPTRIRGVVS